MAIPFLPTNPSASIHIQLELATSFTHSPLANPNCTVNSSHGTSELELVEKHSDLHIHLLQLLRRLNLLHSLHSFIHYNKWSSITKWKNDLQTHGFELLFKKWQQCITTCLSKTQHINRNYLFFSFLCLQLLHCIILFLKLRILF